jgi:hypothetical protein
MAAEIMGINMLDHIIITPKDNFYSYRQDEKLQNKYQTYELEEFAASLGKTYVDE